MLRRTVRSTSTTTGAAVCFGFFSLSLSQNMQNSKVFLFSSSFCLFEGMKEVDGKQECRTKYNTDNRSRNLTRYFTVLFPTSYSSGWCVLVLRQHNLEIPDGLNHHRLESAKALPDFPRASILSFYNSPGRVYNRFRRTAPMVLCSSKSWEVG